MCWNDLESFRCVEHLFTLSTTFLSLTACLHQHLHLTWSTPLAARRRLCIPRPISSARPALISITRIKRSSSVICLDTNTPLKKLWEKLKPLPRTRSQDDDDDDDGDDDDDDDDDASVK